MGADAVGGIPHTELALKSDKMIDVHIDENDALQYRFRF